jgi:hypothetical protein
MREAHPEWTKSQLNCCLYWQTTARKMLTEKLQNFLKEFPDFHVVVAKYSGAPINNRIIWSPPEAMGVNITATMANRGIFLEWPPETVAYQVALASIERKCRVCGCTWNNACRGGCSWIEKDLCSSCFR